MKYSIKTEIKSIKSLDAYPIRLRVSYQGARLELRLGYSIEPKYWDSDNQLVKKGAVNKFGQTAKDINKAISEGKEIIEKIFTEYDRLFTKYPSTDELKEEFYKATNRVLVKKSDKGVVLSLLNDFVRTEGQKNNWTDSTYNKFATLTKHWTEFSEQHWKRSDGKRGINDLTESDLVSFIRYFEKRKLKNTTSIKYIKLFRWFLKWCSTNGYYNGILHDSFRPRLKGVDGNNKEIVYLEWEELMSVYNHEFSPTENYLDRARDIFCFCCFTGLRYSDVNKLTKQDIRNGKIRIVTAKTGDGVYIELNKFSTEIIQKYKEALQYETRVLPPISNQKLNEYIKEVCKKAGLVQPVRTVYFIGGTRLEEVVPKNELISTHAGRRTFVVSALTLGISESVIIEWTGHADFSSLKPYKKIVNGLKVREMQKFDEAFEPRKSPQK
jgi:integrase